MSIVAETGARVREVLRRCEGGFLESVGFGTTGEEDHVDIQISQAQGWELVTVRLHGVRHFAIGKGPDIMGSFVDEVSAVPLPAGDPVWPVEVSGLITRFPGLPDLYWVRVVGPTELICLATVLTVSVSA
ncbi:hypothetical protein [Spongiactinospora sp. 9N601]|uniref:hypothetical protein n=1 Tax=Spongiactinospora sp. 9N601 TaxID=3375149 RepID=UPI00378B4224